MDLPDGYQLRAPNSNDLEAVADVLATNDLEEAGQIVMRVLRRWDLWERSS